MATRQNAAELRSWDDETRAIIYEGASVNQLSKLFRMDVKTLAPKLASASPVGERGGLPIYAVHEVAPLLVKPQGDLAAHIRRMNHKDLPPLLAKEFWQGLRERRRYEELAGELWATEDVVRAAGEAFAEIRMALLLVPDELERTTQLSDDQKEWVQRLIDRVMETARGRLVRHFAKPDDAAPRGSEPPVG